MSSIPPDPVYVPDLVSEAERYLATVDYFRSQGCEPEWLSEGTHAQAVLLDAPPARVMADNELSVDDRL